MVPLACTRQETGQDSRICSRSRRFRVGQSAASWCHPDPTTVPDRRRSLADKNPHTVEVAPIVALRVNLPVARAVAAGLIVAQHHHLGVTGASAPEPDHTRLGVTSLVALETSTAAIAIVAVQCQPVVEARITPRASSG